MLERNLIQSTGFRNIGPIDARTGFEVRVRLPNYHGTRLSLIDGFGVVVDDEVYSYERNRLLLRGKLYTLKDLRDETEARWDLFEWAAIVVTKPGGLQPGVHRVSVTGRVRYSYFPPQFHVFEVPAERLATIVFA